MGVTNLSKAVLKVADFPMGAGPTQKDWKVIKLLAVWIQIQAALCERRFHGLDLLVGGYGTDDLYCSLKRVDLYCSLKTTSQNIQLGQRQTSSFGFLDLPSNVTLLYSFLASFTTKKKVPVKKRYKLRWAIWEQVWNGWSGKRSLKNEINVYHKMGEATKQRPNYP